MLLFLKGMEKGLQNLKTVFILTAAETLLVFVMGFAAPLLFVFLLCLIVPASAYITLRGRAYFALFPLAAYGALILFNYDIIYILCLPFALLAYSALLRAAKSGKLYYSVSLVILAVLTGFLIPSAVFPAAKKQTAGKAAAEYAVSSSVPFFKDAARNYVYEREIVNALNAGGGAADAEEIKRGAALAVSEMSDEYVLSRYAEEVERTVSENILYFIFSIGILAAMAMLFILTLLLSAYQYALKDAEKLPYFLNKTAYPVTPVRFWKMPKHYVLFVLVPYVVFFIAGLFSPELTKLFNATYFGAVLVPFGFAGLSVVYYLLSRVKIGKFKFNNGLSTLLCAIICAAAFPLFSAIGVVDYFLNVRFVDEHYGKQNKNNGGKKT